MNRGEEWARKKDARVVGDGEFVLAPFLSGEVGEIRREGSRLERLPGVAGLRSLSRRVAERRPS
jgi:hypothetical protein